jgi:hypothetical protein
MTAIDPEMTKPEPKRKPKPDTGLCSTHTGGPHPMEPACKDWRAAQLGEKAAPSAKLPIDRPCSACGDGDTEMKYHDHEPPFRSPQNDSAPIIGKAPLLPAEARIAELEQKIRDIKKIAEQALGAESPQKEVPNAGPVSAESINVVAGDHRAAEVTSGAESQPASKEPER